MLSIGCRDFLSCGDLHLDLAGQPIIVTGPNGAGKSNLGRVVDLISTVVGHYSGRPAADRLGLYNRAGRFGATSFQVAVKIELDQAWEQELVAAFVRAAFVCGADSASSPSLPTRAQLDAAVRDQLDPASLFPLWTGTLHVHYDAAWSQPWFAAWEFTHADATWHIQLVGGSSFLRLGPTDARGRVPAQTRNFSHWWQQRPAGLGDFTKVLPPSQVEALSFSVTPPNDGSSPLPVTLLDLAARLGEREIDNRSFDFIHVLAAILRQGIVVTDNRRLPLERRFSHQALQRSFDLRDGGGVAGELYRCKNGPLALRQRYAQAKELFTDLTGRALGVQASPDPEEPGTMLIDVTVVDGDYEVPIAFAGAGIQEALLLSTLLTGKSGRVIVLDEPAVNLEPTLQRRLIPVLDARRAQCIVITHSADLVPASTPADLSRIVRLAPHPSGTQVFRTPQDLPAQEQTRWLQRLGTSEARAPLFAAGVILCEGATETGALSRWWDSTHCPEWGPLSAANICLMRVDGDTAFHGYIDYLEAFGIPWAIVADGPALSPGSRLHEHLTAKNLLPDGQPDPSDTFTRWKGYWEEAGVFTFAREFGTDGNKGGEFEALLTELDPELYEQARKEHGRSKPRVGAHFAAHHSNPPTPVTDLYRRIREHLDPEVGRQ
ncbi:AAA family ATPase [Streptomyces liliifuscus]|uniref:AAA family ATPase n=1 Tax=Streptomyces liliifuscus TaxID=2797636 RepID=A0A7T7KUC6_9ACTN|nr:AAA family ATPase [Streptomyces liliifuscus]QQM38059.1 AAA family ATPase [Streptomyces liliifuscus]